MYDLKVEVLKTVNERTGFAVSTHFAGGHEVVADTFFEVASFAHINDAPQSVPHQVNAGLVRRVSEFPAGSWVCSSMNVTESRVGCFVNQMLREDDSSLFQ